MQSNFLPATAERVQQATSRKSNEAIRRETDMRVRDIVRRGGSAIDRRLRELDQEWDIERTLEANAATLAFAGTILGATVDRRFLLLPAAVGGFLLQHALQGWCPPLPLFRKAGVRTAKENNEERYALKLARGDFDGVADRHGHEHIDARTIMEAVRR